MVSIIIPLRQDQGYLKPCIDACLKQEMEVEIIVLPDVPLPSPDLRVIEEATGSMSPARKRNRGVELSHGDILAFIDDDTRPQPGWLAAALVHFQTADVGAVGGPSVTPHNDPFWAQVSGVVYESWMISGTEFYRYRPGTLRDVTDFPSCNLLVRRSVFEKVGGFRTDFWPGEDTEFCLSLVKEGYRIRYEPRAVIEHHRRPSLKKHFIQLGNYGLHRGYFAKRYPETSCKLPYFMPSMAVLAGVVLSILALLGQPGAGWILALLSSIYALLLLVSFVGTSLSLIIPAFMVAFASHLIYGVSFLGGLISPRLPEEAEIL